MPALPAHGSPSQSLTRWSRALLLLLLAVAAGNLGCVRRRMLIRSNPPGAMVYVDNQPIGPTPIATSFLYYGTRELRLVKAGYETLTINQPIPAPWYQIPPLDFVSENLVPREIQDYRTLSYNLLPQQVVPSEQIVANAEQLRQATRGAGSGTPVGGWPMAAPVAGTPTLAPPVSEPLAEPLPGAPTFAPPPVPNAYGDGALPPGGAPLTPGVPR